MGLLCSRYCNKTKLIRQVDKFVLRHLTPRVELCKYNEGFISRLHNVAVAAEAVVPNFAAEGVCSLFFEDVLLFYDTLEGFCHERLQLLKANLQRGVLV